MINIIIKGWSFYVPSLKSIAGNIGLNISCYAYYSADISDTSHIL